MEGFQRGSEVHRPSVVRYQSHRPRKTHEKTGVSNRIIMENAAKIAQNRINIVATVPVIPGINDNERNLKDIAIFARKHGILRVRLLPYHKLGIGKYKILGRDHDLDALSPPTSERLHEVAKIMETYGLDVSAEA